MNADERAHVEATASGPGAPYAAVVVTDKPDLVAFLTARWDEIEAAAKAAYPGPADHPQSMADAAFIALNDPAYVLADIAAKRKILAEHGPTQQRGLWHESTKSYDAEIVCETCVFVGDDEDAGGNEFRYRERAEYPCHTVLLLAAPFRAHKDFQEEWLG